MWQILLAAAVVGTGFLAKHFLINGVHKGLSSSEQKNNNEESVGEICDPKRENSTVEEKGVFRFSSSGNVDGRESKGLRKRISGGKRRIGVEKKLGFVDRDEGVVEEKKKKKEKGRRGFVCLKKRAGWNSFRKCGSSSSEGKGRSFFSSGLAVGLMYFISAGKVEIDKLDAAVTEATKVVNGLKSVLNKRKMSCDLQDLSHEKSFKTSPKPLGKDKQRLVTASTVEGPKSSDTRVLVPHFIDDGDCASSVLTEEQEDMLEIDQLEAELESELQKLSCCTSEYPSGRRGRTSNLCELDPEQVMGATSSELSTGGLLVPHEVGKDSDSVEFHGVSPFELDRELCHLLIEQQESQIVELEASLHSTETKLSEKAVELQALKNRVHHIREFSLQTSSDEEPEEETIYVEQEINGDANSRPLSNFNKGTPTGHRTEIAEWDEKDNRV